MLKKYLKCESGDADGGVMGGIFLSGLFIAVACVGLALAYGIKISTIVSSFTDKF